MKSFLLCLYILSGLLLCDAGSDDAVTCGSVVKIIHKESGHHLHSHPIAWGSGSGQQSVTSTGSSDDTGSLWLVKDATTADGPCAAGTPIVCGSKLRLEHVNTGKNLHSHLFRAALTGNQEVSGFGEDGTGDTGDNWKLVCDSTSAKYWQRGSNFHLEHVDTRKYLYTATKAKFTAQNCGQGCPIMGQTEMSCSSSKGLATKFMTGQGVYFPFTDGQVEEEDDDEL